MQVLANILDKPMDRSEFLKHVGAGAAALLGGSMIARAVTGMDRSASGQKSNGYGSSAYGGTKR